MIDNFDKIIPFLSFETEDDFYHLQIIKRKKENSELGSNSLVVKTYYVKSVEYLNKIRNEVITLCDLTNSRACLNLNRRSFEKLAFHTLRKVTEQILNKDYKSVKRAYESCCGAFSNEKDKKWIIDFDEFDEDKINIIINNIKNCSPNTGFPKVLGLIPTKNGYHIITKPFNINEYGEGLTIHKDNPTILYCNTKIL
jgi:hypothetical protein